MRKLALGVTTAAVLLTAAPAVAQIGFDAGPRGFGVEVGPSHGYYRAYPHRHYWGYPNWHRHAHFWGPRW